MTYCSIALHRHHADDLVAQVSGECEKRGLRLTSLRRRVLEMVAQSDTPVKAYDLLDQLKREHAGAAPPTVYRALDFLIEQGFVHRIESLNAYLGCPHPAQRHPTQFLICDQCGVTMELEDAELDQRLFAQARTQRFKPTRQVVEVHGLCARCTESKPS